MCTVDFLKTTTSKENLKIAMDIIAEFKKNESSIEWVDTPFVQWFKLEQLESYLKNLVNNEPIEKGYVFWFEEKSAEDSKFFIEKVKAKE